jgi:DNA (cytosine-5)-methyltransferase 1
MPGFYEFFAGGGMARAGLGPNWSCLFANDFDPKKAVVYTDNWGAKGFVPGDVSRVKLSQLPGVADLAWASFPCQDLSLAGGGAGLKGERSGTFWPFWKKIKALRAEGRAPKLIALENVCGTLYSHGGKDFAAICKALASADYKFGAVIIDAVHFLPQSRPRLFVVATRGDLLSDVTLNRPDEHFHTEALQAAYQQLDATTKKSWVWWRLPMPSKRNSSFIDLVEEEPEGVAWHTAEQTARLLSLMSPLHKEKLRLAKQSGSRLVGGVYKRTRLNEAGEKVQRAEVRFDGISGCLRTPNGGSSRQSIILVEGNKVRSRLISPREAASLMGLTDTYRLPKNYNEAYHIAGDGVAVPVVRFLAENLLEPLLSVSRKRKRAA